MDYEAGPLCRCEDQMIRKICYDTAGALLFLGVLIAALSIAEMIG